jgi:ATP-dependent DNA helicase RecG
MGKIPDLSQQLSLAFKEPLALMSPDQIFARASQKLFESLKEDRRIERKPIGIHAEELAKYFSMWANTKPDGGVIVVGIDDDGLVSKAGSSIAMEAVNRLEGAGYTYCPDARVESKRISAIGECGEEDFLLVFRIPYDPHKVIKTVSGEAYIRIADRKIKLKPDEVYHLSTDRGQIDVEQELLDISYPDDLDWNSVSQYASAVKKAHELDESKSVAEILEYQHLGKRKAGVFRPNVACGLLFAKDPVGLLPGCKIRFLRYEGEHEGTGESLNVIKDQEVTGTVPEIIARTEAILDSQLRTFSKLGKDGKFYTAPEYPKMAWYEAIVNACVHRSYALRTMNIFVKMFDDRLEVESPGGFPPLVSPQNIYDMHQPRNPHLMTAMRYLAFVKAMNEGTRRMRDTMSAALLPLPEFAEKSGESSHKVRVTLRNSVKQRKVWVLADVNALIGEQLSKGLNEVEKLAVNFAAEHGRINVSQLQRLTGRSWPSASKCLRALGEKGVFEFHHRDFIDRDPQAFYTLKTLGKV